MWQYDHGGDIYGNSGVKFDFSVNTNPMGLPFSIREAIISHIDEFTLYPDFKCRKLQNKISKFEDIPQEWILCGNGAADLIYRICYAVKPVKALLVIPTFSEYEKALRRVNCQIDYHLLTEYNNFELTEEILDKLNPEINILFLCQPNNPTGRLISEDLVEAVLEKTKNTSTIVVIDECFLDFTTDGISAKRYLEDIPRLIILKAFTKMYAMAGLRLGYLLCSCKNLINNVFCSAQCWSVSYPAQIAGIAALDLLDWQYETRELINRERIFLTKSLQELEMTLFPTDANFILLRSEKFLYESLLEKGILIRSCKNFKGLDNSYYRIAIKTRQENIYLVETLKEVLNG